MLAVGVDVGDEHVERLRVTATHLLRAPGARHCPSLGHHDQGPAKHELRMGDFAIRSVDHDACLEAERLCQPDNRAI